MCALEKPRLLFISHSSEDNECAIKIRDWLEQQGYSRSQVFLDLADFRNGDRWRYRLDELGRHCDAVIACLSDNWIGSAECIREFTFAESRNKPLFAVIVKKITRSIPSFVSAIQFSDVSTPLQEVRGFELLRAGLLSAQVAPNTFPWPPIEEPTRSVFRGLLPLDVQDAAVFFGRDAHIARSISALRHLRDGAAERLLVILGASGSGKSSFLRAGIIARLKRDVDNFVVLPVVRPGNAAISGDHGLNSGLSSALGIDVQISSGDDLLKLFESLRSTAIERISSIKAASGDTFSAKPPTIVLPIDQAEELFNTENSETDSFCDIVEEAIFRDQNALIIATIRSNSYEALQSGLMPESQELFTLPPVALGAFQEIISGPAAKAKPPIKVEPELIQKLLSDLDSRDALPLLAFTLERLVVQHGNGVELTLHDYVKRLGGMSGAVNSALVGVFGEQPNEKELALARNLFIPGLIQVDADGVKRRIGNLKNLDEELRSLAEKFIEQRLLVSDAGTIEIAHESILRQWPALSSWISESREELLDANALLASAREWLRKNKADAKLAHRNDVSAAFTLVERFKNVWEKDYDLVVSYLLACDEISQVEGLIYRDARTGLPNAIALERHVNATLPNASFEHPAAFLLLDIDRLGKTLEQVGTAQGDMLMEAAAQRLNKALADFGKPTEAAVGSNLLAAFSDNRFVLYLPSAISRDYVISIARAIRAAFAAPFELPMREITMSISGGIVIAPEDGDSFAILMQNARLALRLVRSEAQSGFRFFTPRLTRIVQGRNRFEAELRDAVGNKDFNAVFQPKICFATGRILGAEALARWRRPNGKLIAPATFIPVAEQTGLIDAIGTQILEAACEAARSWQLEGFNLTVAVNVSPSQLARTDFTEFIKTELGRTGLHPNLLELEITESMAVNDPARVAEFISPLRAMGTKLAIDGFGTGQSSLATLTQLPFDVFKIDRHFVSALETDRQAPAIVEMVLAMAETLGLETVAVGVESERQAEFLRRRGCTMAQGFFYSPGLSDTNFLDFVRAWRPEPPFPPFVQQSAKAA